MAYFRRMRLGPDARRPRRTFMMITDTQDSRGGGSSGGGGGHSGRGGGVRIFHIVAAEEVSDQLGAAARAAAAAAEKRRGKKRRGKKQAEASGEDENARGLKDTYRFQVQEVSLAAMDTDLVEMVRCGWRVTCRSCHLLCLCWHSPSLPCSPMTR